MAHKLVIPNYAEAVARLNVKQASKYTEEETLHYLRSAYRLALKFLGQPVHKFRITVSKANKQFNSSFTGIAKEIRYQARFIDDLDTPLKEYDASCSQCWCFTTLENKKMQCFIAKHWPEYLELAIGIFEILQTKQDYQLYKNLTTSGGFYSYMLEKVNSYYNKRFEAGLMKRRCTVDLEYIKSKAMQILFSKDIIYKK
jgi:hypothetical protein